jgi:AP-2 complex subunit alpha
MRNDIVGRVNYGQSLALAAIANIGGIDLSEALVSDVQRLVLESDSSAIAYLGGVDDARNKSFLIKKACLCLLRLWRNNIHCLDLSDWVSRL